MTDRPNPLSLENVAAATSEASGNWPKSATALRIALVWPAAAKLTSLSVRYERFVQGFRTLGHNPFTVCLPSAAVGYAERVAAASTDAELRDTRFWRSLEIDVAVIITWLGLPDLVRAIKAACPWVVSIADSDGQIGVRVHPGATLYRMVLQHAPLTDRIRAAGYWGRIYLFDWGRPDQSVLESASHADSIAVGDPCIVDHLRRFFTHYNRPDLTAKVIVAPYPVDSPFLVTTVPANRANQVAAIGRWDSSQKDAGLLCRSAELYLAAGAKTTFVVIGPNGDQWFAPLVSRWGERFRYLGRQPPETVAEVLSRSRTLILPSRWEGAPIVLNEALASGCTVVGTDAVPSVVSACSEGGFGAVSVGRSAARLARALGDEMAAWDRGDRDPVKIAAHWRPRFEPAAVCRELLSHRHGVRSA